MRTPERALLYTLLELFQQFVAALDDVLGAVLGRNLAGHDAFDFSVFDFADLRQEAQAQATRLRGGFDVQLLDADFGARVLVIETRLSWSARRRPW